MVDAADSMTDMGTLRSCLLTRRYIKVSSNKARRPVAGWFPIEGFVFDSSTNVRGKGVEV